MKNIFMAVLFIAITIMSCSKDECTKEQFVGKWKGDYSCTVLGSGSNSIIDITSGSGSNIDIRETFTLTSPDFFSNVTLSVDDCMAEKDERVLGTGTLYTAELQDGGSTLILKYSVTGFGLTAETCTYTLKPE